MADSKADKAWSQLLDKYHILQQVADHGIYEISAEQIKEFREPRLMAKWDSSEDLPDTLSKAHLNILPLSRSSYALSDFSLYEPFPHRTLVPLNYITPRPFETIDFNHLTSEANAINAMNVTGILDQFLGTEPGMTVETFNGRMGTGKFDFKVDHASGTSSTVHVENAQLEIDGGFENDDSIIIMEAKNVPHPDFHVRQLYFPYRLWHGKVSKPIRLVFSQYVDSIYHLFEYEFTEPENYSSIHLLRQADYTFQTEPISLQDIERVWSSTPVLTDDNSENTTIPFPQANTFTTVITLAQQLQRVENMNKDEIATFMEFDPRQANYYMAAGEYVGVIEKTPTNSKRAQLTQEGKQIHTLDVRKRRLAYVRLLFQHKIFHHFYEQVMQEGELPSKEDISEYLMRNNICLSESTAERRASTVTSWLNWILSLADR